jgi:hypothetical protein
MADREALAAAWSELLGIEVDDDVDFFEAGGHSLLATQLTGRVKRDVGLPVRVNLLFENPRFGDYVDAVAIVDEA